MTDPATGNLTFSIDARHVRQLGRELVADRITAVSELIKNAYDADATNVEVIFAPESRKRSGAWLLVRDNGSGMNLEELKARWMVISTAFKDSASISDRYHRRRAGQKGIGRFATESLGTHLRLRSTKAGHGEQATVDFDWATAYASGTRLDAVQNPYRVEATKPTEHGTELLIEGLHDAWDEKALQRVREAVFLLQPPFKLAEAEPPPRGSAPVDPGFRVLVRYENEASDTAAPGDVDTVLAAATAWVEGTVNADGSLTRRIYSEHLGIDETETLERRALVTGVLSFRAAYFIFKRDALDPQASVGVRRARALAEQFGGLRLYRDGLRILPYGEPENDWLSLDAIYRRRGQVLAPIGNSNFFGEVLVSREANFLLVDTASREGVVENDAFLELQGVLRDALVWAVNKVAAIRQRKLSAGGPHARPPATREELVDPVTVAAERVAGATSDASRQDALGELIALTRGAQEEARRSDREEEAAVLALLDELSLLRVLASVGAAIAIFSHEVGAVLTQAIAAVGDLAERLEQTGGEMAGEIERAEQGLQGVSDLASYLDLYIGQSGRRRRRDQPVADVLDRFVQSVAPLLNRRGVELDADVNPTHLRTAPMSRSELEAVLYNFLTNSLKALDDERLDARRIHIEAREESPFVVIRFLDTGRGIEERIRDRIFDAFVTTTEEADSELGAGTGLGLKIVADIAESNGGRATVGEAAPPFRTCMELFLPAWRSSEAKEDNAEMDET
jgi:signal transduction histidine kinase